MLAVRVGIMSINIAEAVKHFAAYTLKEVAWDCWLSSEKMKEQNLKR